jgi:hypothetical protein
MTKTFVQHLKGKSDFIFSLGMPRWTWILLFAVIGVQFGIIEVLLHVGIATGLFYIGYRKELAIQKRQATKTKIKE